MAQTPRLPIILDTDIGDDIDDALALALLLLCPEYDLRGVTTVFRNAPRRALLAREVLRAFNAAHIPVAAGVSKPLLQEVDMKTGSQLSILEDDTWQEEPPHAVDFLVQQAHAQAHAVESQEAAFTIACIGPLTNIALAIAREPSLIHKARLVIMGGFLRGDYAEWNIRCDPEAAAIVFSSGIAIDMIGLDVTLGCHLSDEQVKRVEEVHPLLGRLMKCWTGDDNHPITLHDPLAVMTMVSDVVRFDPRRIEIGLCGEARGHTQVLEVLEGEPNVRAAVEVDAARAVDEFVARLTGEKM